MLGHELFINNNLEVLLTLHLGYTLWKGQHKDFQSQRENFNGSFLVPISCGIFPSLKVMALWPPDVLCAIHNTQFLFRKVYLRQKVIWFLLYWSFTLNFKYLKLCELSEGNQDTQSVSILEKKLSKALILPCHSKYQLPVCFTFLTEGLVTY